MWPRSGNLRDWALMRSVPPPDPGGIFTGPVEVLKRNSKQNKYDSLSNGLF